MQSPHVYKCNWVLLGNFSGIVYDAAPAAAAAAAAVNTTP
jgi:hypothetical protein